MLVVESLVDAFDRSVRAAVFEHLMAGSLGPTPPDIAKRTGHSAGRVAESFQRLLAEHRLVLSSRGDRVVMAHPFSGLPTDYRSEIGDQRWWANCAWDAFAILALLGDGKVHSRSEEGTESTWTVRNGVVRPDGLVHFVIPARRFWDDIGFT